MRLQTIAETGSPLKPVVGIYVIVNYMKRLTDKQTLLCSMVNTELRHHNFDLSRSILYNTQEAIGSVRKKPIIGSWRISGIMRYSRGACCIWCSLHDLAILEEIESESSQESIRGCSA